MADDDREPSRPQSERYEPVDEPSDAHLGGSTLNQVRSTLHDLENRLQETYERLRKVEDLYHRQVSETENAAYRADYANWRWQSARARRWWRVREAVTQVKRTPSAVLRLPAEVVRATRKTDTPKPPQRPEARGDKAHRPRPAPQSADHDSAIPPIPLIPVPAGPIVRPELTVAVILGEFSTTALRYEWRQFEPGRDDWQEVMTQESPGLLFVESAGLGNGGLWDGPMNGPRIPGQALRDIVEWCRGRDIPTVFWNTDDPSGFDLFIDTAKLFDHVFTTCGETVPRYREILGHDRVGVLSFAAQPRIHNPVNHSTVRRNDVAFAGTYDAQDLGRAEQIRTVLEPARASGLHVYSRMPADDRRYEFPAEYDRHVVGALPYERILAAYKAYKVFLNVNSVSDSPTVVPRRVFELAACDTPILSGYSRAIEGLFSGAVPISRTREETRTLLPGLLANPEVRDRQAHLAMREVFERHTYGHRVEAVLKAIGRPTPRPEPHVSVIMVTNRPALLSYAIGQVAAQRWRRLQLVLVLHGLDLEPDVVRDKIFAEERLDDVVVLTADGSMPLGACLNLAIDAADGDLIAKMDDDDIYGEHFLPDLVRAFLYTDADIVGKLACYMQLRAMNATLLSSPEAEHTYNDLVRGGTLVVRADVLRRLRFDHVPVGSDTKMLRRANAEGIRIYSADRFNYIYVRNADPSAHTWQVSDAAFLKSSRVLFYGPPEQHVCV